MFQLSKLTKVILFGFTFNNKIIHFQVENTGKNVVLLQGIFLFSKL